MLSRLPKHWEHFRVYKTNLSDPSQCRLQQESLISVTSGNLHPSWRACGADSWRAWEASSSPGEQLGNQMSWKDWQSTLQAASCQENCPGGRVVGLANLFPCMLSIDTKKNTTEKPKKGIDISLAEYICVYMCVCTCVCIYIHIYTLYDL